MQAFDLMANQEVEHQAVIVINVAPAEQAPNVAGLVVNNNQAGNNEDAAAARGRRLVPWRIDNRLDEVMLKLMMALKTYKKIQGKGLVVYDYFRSQK